jgi:cytochrome c peroxidase
MTSPQPSHEVRGRRGTIRLGFMALAAAVVLCSLLGCTGEPASADPPLDPNQRLSRRERLGKHIFHDTRLSEPQVMSCATCHDPERAFSGNNGSTIGVPRGATGALGLRNTPTVMYASFAPTFSVVSGDDGDTPTGGQFLDGRVDTQAQQALMPFLNASEMNNPDAATVVAKIQAGSYAADFRAEFGGDIFSRPDDAFAAIGQAVEAYERTAEFHPFSSRYDDYLRGHDTFSAAERRGMSLFFNSQKANCVACHAASPTDADPRNSLFTDFTYDNLGVPRNPDIPANADPTFFDIGLGGPKRTLPNGDPSFAGAFKVPTLRNAAIKEALFHNGRFTNLDDLVAFYITRDTDPSRWYPGGVRFNDLPPAYQGNVNTSEAPYDRHLGETPRLTPTEQADLVAFLHTLTDQQFEPLLPPPHADN